MVMKHTRCPRRAGTGSIGLLIALGLVATSCSKPASETRPMEMPASVRTPAPPAADAAARGPIEVRIPDDAQKRAGIAMNVPVTRSMPASFRLPGNLAPDAYGQLTIVALVGGRVTSVPVELGTVVAPDQPVATILSTEFADAQAAYLSHRAAVIADHQRVTRLERLVEIGASSRQELDDAHAMHIQHTSEVERAKARLKLLGFRETTIDMLAATGDVTADYVVRAPTAGVVTKRDVNLGQIVSGDFGVIEVSRLDRLWVMASAYEQDLRRLRTGMTATVTFRGRGDKPISSRIAYVDPQVDAATRTGQVRLEIANPTGQLRFGMLVDVDVETPGAETALSVPTGAVQLIGESRVVYVQDAVRLEVFREVRVSTGRVRDGFTEIQSGLLATDRVVTGGAFFVRSERLRLLPAAVGGTTANATGATAEVTASQSRRVRVEITAAGFQPSRIEAPADIDVAIVFLRTTDDTCATEVVVPSLGIRRALPLGQEVEVLVPAGSAREIPFVCGMDMLRGALVIGGR